MFNTHNQQKHFNDILKLLRPGLDTMAKSPIRSTAVDILALSCTWWRLRQNGMSQRLLIESLTSGVLQENLSVDDLDMARHIREYYSKKITVWQLQGIELTKFRQELAAFLTTGGTETQEHHCGIAYKLPEFYIYDTEIDRMVDTVFNTGAELTSQFAIHRVIPVKMLTRNVKYAKRLVYFFKMADGGAAVRSEISHDNMLLHIWNKLFEGGGSMLLQGKYEPSNAGFKHYTLRNWKLVDDLTLKPKEEEIQQY